MTYGAQTGQCSLYRITVWNPHDRLRSKWRGYIGETERLPIERLAEHLRARYPWGDTICAIEIDDRVWPDKQAVTAAERAAVEAERPLYNDEFNRANPWRIGYEVQVRQRHERDRTNGRPLWQPNARQSRRRPSGTRAASGPRRAPSGRVADRAALSAAGALGRGWRRSRPWLAAWVGVFVVVTVAGSSGDAGMPVGDSAGAAVVVASGGLLWWRSRRGRRRR